MRSIVINNGENSDWFLFDDTFLFKTIKGHGEDGKINVIIDCLYYTYSIKKYPNLNPEIDFTTITSDLDKVQRIFSFLIEYYRDKDVSLFLNYTGYLKELNNEYRPMFKSMGFKIPRKKNACLEYKY